LIWTDVKYALILLTAAGVAASLIRFYFKLAGGRITFIRKKDSDEI
jgi:hypothetical protein